MPSVNASASVHSHMLSVLSKKITAKTAKVHYSTVVIICKEHFDYNKNAAVKINNTLTIFLAICIIINIQKIIT